MNVSVLPLSHASNVRVSINKFTSVNHPLEDSFLVGRFVVPGPAAESFVVVGQAAPVIHIRLSSAAWGPSGKPR